MANVRVVMNGNFNEVLFAAPQVKQAVDEKAKSIAGKANAAANEKSGIWHEVGKPHTPGREGGKWHGADGEVIGGKDADYKAKPARRMGADGAPIAIVVTGNYAAQKDNMKHNTLLRSI